MPVISVYLRDSVYEDLLGKAKKGNFEPRKLAEHLIEDSLASKSPTMVSRKTCPDGSPHLFVVDTARDYQPKFGVAYMCEKCHVRADDIDR